MSEQPSEQPNVFLDAVNELLDTRATVRDLEEQLKAAKQAYDAAEARVIDLWPTDDGVESIKTTRGTIRLRQRIYPKFLVGENGTGKASFIDRIQSDPRFEEYRVLIREDLHLAALNEMVRGFVENHEWPENLAEILGASVKYEVGISAR